MAVPGSPSAFCCCLPMATLSSSMESMLGGGEV